MMPTSLCCNTIFTLLILIPASSAAFAFDRSSTRLYSGKTDVDVEIKLRDSKYADLTPVSELVVKSFYDKPNEVFKHMYRLAELNRLQQNFPYNDVNRHRMLVAVSPTTNDIVGFVDVDARPSTPNVHYQCNPRPILSDLLVCTTMRRNGIARKLVEKCERICQEDFKATELYIRVLEDNEAALRMYEQLGYDIFENPGDPPEVRLLRKDLTSPDDSE